MAQQLLGVIPSKFQNVFQSTENSNAVTYLDYWLLAEIESI